MLFKRRLSWVFSTILIVCLLTTSCQSKREVFNDEKLINAEQLIDKQKFIEQSKVRSDEAVKFGPILDEDVKEDFRSAYRKQIARQVAPDSVELKDSAGWNVFPIDINVENVDIRIFTELLSKTTGHNILVSDEVRGNVTIKLKNVPWPSVMESVLQMKTLAKQIDSKAKIIRIHDQNTIVQLEEFKRKRQENLYKARELEMAAEPKSTEIFKLFYTKPTVIKTTIEGVYGLSGGTAGGGEEYLKSDPEITVDERLNLLIVKARDEDINVISKLIKQLDTRTKQVFIEAFIVEVSDGFQDAFGARIGLNAQNTVINANKDIDGTITGLAGTAANSLSAGDSGASLSNLPITNPFGGVGILAGIGSSAELKLELTAMETDGFSRVVSNPRVFTLDNQEAIIFQGDEVPFETTSDQGTKIEFKEAGLKLAVTPTVIGDGNLLMTIAVNKDTVDTSQSNPPISKSEIKTSLVSKDGAIVVIGGIYDEDKSTSEDRVPGAADLPILGKLFKRKTNIDDRSELMIFIAPRIL